jgi:hypothetical protein
MSEDRSNDPKLKTPRCYFPPDLAAHFGLLFIVLPIAMLSHWLFPLLSRLKRTGDPTIVWMALALGAIGVALLFAARLPLYRQRRFFVFGPRELDERHRRLYRWAYRVVGTSVFLLVLLLLILR